MHLHSINLLVLSFLLVTLNILFFNGVNGQNLPCTMDENFQFTQPNNYSIALSCKVGPEFNQLRVTYSLGGYGSSAYILTESQYNSFIEKVKDKPEYVPPKFGDYLIRFLGTNAYMSSKGIDNTKPRSDLGTIRVLVKRNPNYNGKSSNLSVKLTIIPQQDNTEGIVIVVSSVGAILVLLCCVGCMGGLIFYCVKRRKNSYQEVI